MLPEPQLQNSFGSKVRNHMIEISGIARAKGGLVLSMPGSIISEIQTHEVYIEPYSDIATFALSWQNSKDLLALEVERPDGEIITISSTSDKVRPIYTNRPYIGFQIEQPISGLWKVIVKPERVEEVAYFHLFVFSQNPRISGGIISSSQFCNPSDAIPVQFQAYFDRPITGLKVNGRVTLPDGNQVVTIDFSDDEKKDPKAGIAGNGLYSSSLPSTFAPGMYTIQVVAESDGSATTYAKSDVPPGKEKSYDYDPIPAFRREYTMTVSVGEKPRRSVEVGPKRGYPGQKLKVTVNGNLTHFKPDHTSLDFGDGITISDIKVIDDLTASAMLIIDKKATLGYRYIMATTDLYREVVKFDEGFQVVPRKWVWSDKWIIRLLILIIILLLILLLILAMSLLRGR